MLHKKTQAESNFLFQRDWREAFYAEEEWALAPSDMSVGKTTFLHFSKTDWNFYKELMSGQAEKKTSHHHHNNNNKTTKSKQASKQKQIRKRNRYL